MRRAGPLLLVAASALLVCAPLHLHGPLPVGSDVYATIHYLQGFMKAFSEGDLYPRWTDQTNQGLGAPSFVMFPPLFYYLAGGAAWLAGSVIGGVKLALVVVSLATGFAFYLLAREWSAPGWPAAAGSAVYLLLPYHVLDMYQRFAMSETTAFVFFPLVLLFARRVLRGAGRSAPAGLSLAYAGLLYTHVVSSLLFSLVLAPWLLWEGRGARAGLARAAAALALGAGIAAPTLLPAVIEKSHANMRWVREMPNGDFRLNFIFRDDPIPTLGFKDPVKPPVLKSAHSQLLLAGAAAWIALGLLARGDPRRRDVAVLAAGCGLAYFLQLEISTPVWRIVPELATIQFPWRFQTIMVLTTALLAAALAAARARGGGRAAAGAAASGVGAALAVLLGGANLLLAVQNAHLKPYAFDHETARAPGVVDWSEPALTPVQFEAYPTLKQRRLSVVRAAFTRGAGEARVIAWASSRRLLAVSSDAGGTVEVGSFWFPGWTGALDGGPLEVRPAPGLGTIAFEVPPGSHQVELRFGPTPARAAAWWIGLAAAAASAVWAARAPGGSARSPGAASGPPRPGRTRGRA
jgi:hypothetical protein